VGCPEVRAAHFYSLLTINLRQLPLIQRRQELIREQRTGIRASLQTHRADCRVDLSLDPPWVSVSKAILVYPGCINHAINCEIQASALNIYIHQRVNLLEDRDGIVGVLDGMQPTSDGPFYYPANRIGLVLESHKAHARPQRLA
jgi:hypothetical protein